LCEEGLFAMISTLSKRTSFLKKYSMKRRSLLLVTLLLSSLLVLSGCFGGDDGPSLFNEDETTSEETTTDETISEELPEETAETVAEFGFLVEGTQCIKQLHSGCVPYDYPIYENAKFGLPFSYPSGWVAIASSDTKVVMASPDQDSEDDPTRLYGWREVAADSTVQPEDMKVVDAGTGIVGPYDVTWEIFEGEFEDGTEMKTEWVTLTYDEYNPWVNYTFALVTEESKFIDDQFAIKAAVSSVWYHSENALTE
jgi:hypothetical protein